MLKFYVLYLFFTLGTFSCSTTKNSGCDGGITVTLTDKSGLDGCTWLFTMADGKMLHPINLDDFIEKPMDGKRYVITYTKAEDMFSICMAGEMITLSCVSGLK